MSELAEMEQITKKYGDEYILILRILNDLDVLHNQISSKGYNTRPELQERLSKLIEDASKAKENIDNDISSPPNLSAINLESQYEALMLDLDHQKPI